MTKTERTACPSCASGPVEIFYEVSDVPTNSVLLLETAGEALAFPTGDIRLAFCVNCGHVHNAAFDPNLTEYSGRYESTQGFSGTFNAFHQRLAQDMIDRFELHGKEIIEIGCGNGEFLVLLCELGDNVGLGFDPAYLPGRIPIADATKIDFITDFYSEAYGDRQADLVTCKMTLEHIIDAGRFIRAVRNAIADRLDTMVCFQIPNGRYVLGDLAFWDVYYEHCSYFSHGSLARLFRRENFEVLDLWTDYDDQYLMIAARPTVSSTVAKLDAENDMEALAADVARFSSEVPDAIARWKRELDELHAEGKRTVLWGGGSKGVAFLTTLRMSDQIAAVVDINPNKAGTFMAGRGHEIISPDSLIELQPDVVIVMNPIYIPEITRELDARGLAPGVRPVDALTAR